jgi:hypothetical protein
MTALGLGCVKWQSRVTTSVDYLDAVTWADFAISGPGSTPVYRRALSDVESVDRTISATPQALIAAMRDRTPTMFITRVRL